MRLALVAALSTLALAGTARALTVVPNPVDAGGTQIGVPISKDVSIQNTGNASVNITTLALVSGQGPYTLQNVPGTPISLLPNTGFSFTVVFSPSQNGITKGSVSIVSNDANTPNITLPLTGYAGPPAISLDAASITFGGINLGATSSPAPVNIFDCDPNAGCGMGTTGFSDLTVTDISLGGTNPGDFILDKKGLPGVIPAQLSAPFAISFQPTAAGNRSATCTVKSNAGTSVIALVGSGTMSMLTVDKNSLDFGNTPVKVKSTTQNITLGNSGTGTLKVMSIAFDDASFAQASGAKPPFNIGPMGSSVIGIACTPQKLGTITGSATITTDVGSSTVTLACVGIAPMLTVTPNPVVFGNVAINTGSTPLAVTLTNSGTDTLNINFLNISGNDQADFVSSDEPNTPLSLAPGAQKVFHIVFTPGSSSAESAELDIGSDDPLMPDITVPITGTGIQAGITLSPATPIDFGKVMVGTTPAPQTLTIENSGDTAVTINTISIGGTGASFFSVDMAGPISLAVGMSAKVKVSFEPLTSATEMAVLTVTPAGLTAASVQLKGTGVAPMITLAPSTLDFGNMVPVGSPSDPQVVGIKNSGSTNVTISSIVSTSAAFTVDLTNTAKTALAPGGVTTFAVIYTPTGATLEHATINVMVMEATAAVGTLSASGTGVEPVPRAAGCSLATGRTAAPFPLALLALLLLRRRRRRA